MNTYMNTYMMPTGAYEALDYPRRASSSWSRDLPDWTFITISPGDVPPEGAVPISFIHAAVEQAYNAYHLNGWINWEGGEMPLPQGTLVDVKHRDGTTYTEQFAGSIEGAAAEWFHGDEQNGATSPADIIAYRRTPRRG
ncbi:hypothetical protein HOU02_gp340 [Caulobacter phage CcrBL9]|uniref:Uncharacterized protein n=1 Tax=Caulobacter phage CcrBL9 TaxID=2283270 RepID=A0A385EED3_9CAUD|nr:hypothetical protein HOU02_gp340 [Caulobacter phage CcrBL9]AXQ69385.1 hypothetical protein CcrBL9_gp361 [Caulobacter phage CcrBL9]